MNFGFVSGAWRSTAAASLLVLAGCASAAAFDDYFVAIKRDDPNAITTLLNRNVDPNALSPDGEAPLVLAIREQSTKAVKALLASRKTKVEIRNKKDESPLMLAAIKGDTDLVRALLARDADVNKPGWAPLHYAASASTPQQATIAKLLLDNHAFIDAESPNGTTPLMMAAFYGSSDVARLLLAEGADTAMRNQQGMTAVDFARKGGREDLAKEIAAAATKSAAGQPARTPQPTSPGAMQPSQQSGPRSGW